LPAAQPPVVLINGYQFACILTSGTTSSFGALQQLLTAQGIQSAFYDTCSCDRCAIEEHGARVGALIQSLKNPDGTPVSQVDVVTASMGGLILRSYLTGKKANVRSFTPPDDPKVRKAIFIAAPQFGLIAPELDDNLTDMQLGSRLTWELATWNQNADDLRGIDAIAIAGNGGNKTGDSLDDGIIPLESAALGFVATAVSDPSRTRVLPYCHTTSIPIIVQCKSGATGLAKIDSADNPIYRIIRSFLAGTNEWSTIGESAATNAVLSKNGALVTNAHDAADREIKPSSVTATGQSNSSAKYALSSNTSNVFFRELMQAQPYAVAFQGSTMQASVNVPIGGFRAVELKAGPAITRVYSSAAQTPFLSLAPGMIVSVYGNSLAAGGNTTVLLDGAPAQITYTGDTQVNAILPASTIGWRTITVRNSAGEHSVNVLFESTVPTLYSSDFRGSGPAAATDANTGALLTPSLPAHPGELVALYGTGLGLTERRGNLDWAVIQPTVTVNGTPARVLYAGRSPQYAGLDQINIELPQSARGTVQIQIQAGRHTSNSVTLSVQ
jgi:uncharacterized protein (TIGR03437 family)